MRSDDRRPGRRDEVSLIGWLFGAPGSGATLTVAVSVFALALVVNWSSEREVTRYELAAGELAERMATLEEAARMDVTALSLLTNVLVGNAAVRDADGRRILIDYADDPELQQAVHDITRRLIEAGYEPMGVDREP